MRRRHCPPSPLLFALTLLSVAGCLRAQSGSFVVPPIRAGGGTDFAYWDLFARPPGSPSSTNYNFANPPALLDDLGEDEDGNPTTAFAPRATLLQTGTSSAFITSSAAIYSFSATTSFEVSYQPPPSSAGEVTNVIFQTQTGGSRLDLETVRISYESAGQTHLVAPIYHALDDPQAGTFSERLVCAFQWDLTGLGIRDFKVVFSAPGPSMPLWQAQLDVVAGSPFVQQLGYLLITHARPLVRHGRPGFVDLNLPLGTDDRFFLPGAELHLLGAPEQDWETVGWLHDGQVHEGAEFDVTIPSHDSDVTALFAPLSYSAWRSRIFNHVNSLTGTGDDYTNASISDPDVDHDHDGLDNLLEYAFGCDPYVPDTARARGPISSVEDEGITYPAITYRCNGAPEGQADVSYHVQVSVDRTNWTDNRAAPTTTTVSSVLQADGTALVTERTLQSVENFSRCFMRVVVE